MEHDRLHDCLKAWDAYTTYYFLILAIRQLCKKTYMHAYFTSIY